MVGKIRKETRVEVITEDSKRAFVKWDCQIEESIQDDGRTLKLFVSEPKKKINLWTEEEKAYLDRYFPSDDERRVDALVLMSFMKSKNGK